MNVCKCAPYYYFDQDSRDCVPLKNRIPHCMFETVLDLTSFDEFEPYNQYYEVCYLCEPGYVPEPQIDIFRDGVQNCIPKIKHCKDFDFEVEFFIYDFEAGDFSQGNLGLLSTIMVVIGEYD